MYIERRIILWGGMDKSCAKQTRAFGEVFHPTIDVELKAH